MNEQTEEDINLIAISLERIGVTIFPYSEGTCEMGGGRHSRSVVESLSALAENVGLVADQIGELARAVELIAEIQQQKGQD